MAKTKKKTGRPRIHADQAQAGADRVAAFVARRNELGDIPPVKHRRLKARCATDLALFGWMFCRDLLMHKPSPDLKDGLIHDIQECIMHGGQIAELFGRGCGKTTWLLIGIVWALLYGYTPFAFVIGSSMQAARKNLRTIKGLLQYSDALLADFPAICRSIRAINGVAQRASQQTYHGENTNLEFAVESLTLPMLRDDKGIPLEKGCGGILQVAGVGSSIRGANINGVRPSLILLDDPQTIKDATSATRVESILSYISGDVLGLGGHEKTISCFVAITPQRPGDVAMELASGKHAEWSTKVQPFVKSLPKEWDKLCELFADEFAADAAAKDFKRTRSTAWYQANKGLFADMAVIDNQQYDKSREVDANHHMLNLRAALGKTAWDAEYQMIVQEAATSLNVTADRVCTALNGAARLVCPPGTDTVVGFCDVNAQAGAGLSWTLCAFGPQRVASVIAYGRYPENGEALVPPNASATTTSKRVTAAIRHIVTMMSQMRIRDTRGHAVRIRAFAFDRGWLPDVVHRALFVIRKSVPVGFPICTMRGFGWKQHGRKKTDILRRGDHIFAARSKIGEYLSVHADYWREVAQSSWLEQPLTPGSLSIYGSDPTAHYRFAQEVVAVKLSRKYPVYQGGETVQGYDWLETGPEHWGDAVTGCFALASWFRAYDALAATIDMVALGVQPYDGAKDETGGIGDAKLAEPEGDLEADLEDGKDTSKYNSIPAKTQARKIVRMRQFKRGRWTH